MIHGCPENEDGSLWRCTEWAHCSTKYLPGHQDEILNQKLQRKVEQREREEKRVAALHEIKVPLRLSASPPPCLSASRSAQQAERSFADGACLRLGCRSRSPLRIQNRNTEQHRLLIGHPISSRMGFSPFQFRSKFLSCGRFGPLITLIFCSSQSARHRSRVANAHELNG